MKKILVTGGAGFIGSAVIRYLIKQSDHTVINLDRLTYAGNLGSLKEVAQPTVSFRTGRHLRSIRTGKSV